MKVCFVTRSQKYEIGGLDRYSHEVIRRMSGEPGIEVSAIVELSSGAGYEHAVLADPTHSPWALFDNVRKVRPLLKNCDVIHALDLYPYGLVAALAAVGMNKRLFINGVGTESVVKLDHPLLGPVLKWVYRRAEKVLCISEYTKKRILEKAPDLKNVEVVYLGVDSEKFANKELPAAHEHLTLIGVGAIKRRKGYHVSIPAVARLKAKYPGLKYYIVGSQSIGKYVESLKQTVKELRLEDTVEFLENISDTRLNELYAASDVFVLTSVNVGQHFEGYGLVFLEAGALGLPSVGTRGCGIQEAINDGVTGLLVPQEDVEATTAALDRLLADPGLRKTMGQAAREFARGLDWDKTVACYKHHYQAAL